MDEYIQEADEGVKLIALGGTEFQIFQRKGNRIALKYFLCY
jgi:hypothetical protein